MTVQKNLIVAIIISMTNVMISLIANVYRLSAMLPRCMVLISYNDSGISIVIELFDLQTS